MDPTHSLTHSLTHSHDDDTTLTSLCFLFFLIVIVSIQKIFFQIFKKLFWVGSWIHEEGKNKKTPKKKTKTKTKKCRLAFSFQLSTFNFFFFFGKGRWGWGFPYDHDQNDEVQQCTKVNKLWVFFCCVEIFISLRKRHPQILYWFLLGAQMEVSVLLF
jgi:hypothetical protein